TLFYIICSIYATIFGGITIALLLRNFYGDLFLGKTLLATLGWVSFFAIESFGSLIVALFWSFTNSICDSESAQSGYPLIISNAPFGAIGGSAFIIFAPTVGVWQLFLLVTLFVVGVIPVIHYFMKTIPASQMVGNKQAAATEKKEEGFIEGFTVGIKLI